MAKNLSLVFDYDMSLCDEVPTQFTEKIDLKKAKIVQNNYEVLRGKMGLFRDAKNGYAKMADEAILTILNRYIKAKIKSDRIDYKYARHKEGGRLFSTTPSLQGLSRVFRHTVAADLYDDADIVNAHPEIFRQLGERHNFPTDKLKYYSDNREDCLLSLMEHSSLTRDEAKNLPLKSLNGGYPTKKDYPQWFQDFHTQCCDLRQAILKLPEYKELLKKAKRSSDARTQKNPEGSAINNVFCLWENRILQAMIRVAGTRSATVGALCFDGLMLYKDPSRDNESLLKEMEAAITEETDFKMTLKIKPMTEGLDLSGFLPKSTQPGRFGTDLDKAKMAHELVGDSVKITWQPGDWHYGYIWNPTTLLWEESVKEKLQAHIMNALLEESRRLEGECEDEESKTSMEKAIRTLSSANGQTACFKMCIALFQDIEFKKKLDPVNTEVIALQEGVLYNMKTRESRPRTQTDLYSWEMPVSLTEDTEEASDYINGLVSNNKAPILLSLMGYFFSSLNFAKMFFVFIGKPDTGKSTFFGFIERMLGRHAVPMSNRAIMTSKNKAVHEDELIKALTNTKMSLVKEIAKGEELCSQVIKKVIGGDEQTLRACGGRSVHFTPISKVGMTVNTRPEYNQEMEGKMYHFEFPFQFAKTSANIRKITELRQSQIFLDGLFTLIMASAYDVYSSETIPDSVDDDKYLTSSVKEWIEEKCVLGDDTTADQYRYSVVEAWENYSLWVKKNGKSPETKEFLKEKIQALTEGEPKQLRYVNSKGTKCNGMVYVGIRPRNEAIIEDEEPIRLIPRKTTQEKMKSAGDD